MLFNICLSSRHPELLDFKFPNKTFFHVMCIQRKSLGCFFLHSHNCWRYLHTLYQLYFVKYDILSYFFLGRGQINNHTTVIRYCYIHPKLFGRYPNKECRVLREATFPLCLNFLCTNYSVYW